MRRNTFFHRAKSSNGIPGYVNSCRPFGTGVSFCSLPRTSSWAKLTPRLWRSFLGMRGQVPNSQVDLSQVNPAQVHLDTEGRTTRSPRQQTSIATSSGGTSRYPGGLALLGRLVLDDVACDSACRHCQRTRQIHLPRAAASWEVTILRADHHLVRPLRNSRPGINARAATRLDHVRAGFLENVEIALAHAVLARLLRTELKIELAAVRDALALPQRVAQHQRVHVHVFVLARRAGAAVGDLDRHGRVELANELA